MQGIAGQRGARPDRPRERMTRGEFLEWVRTKVVAPRAAPGQGPRGEGWYWEAMVAPHTYFAVDVLDPHGGTIRVHLHTSDDRVKRSWLEKRPAVRAVPVALAWTTPIHRDNGSRKRCYLGFAWNIRSEDYSVEQEAVLALADWLDQLWSRGAE
jgi:hypothetical protein